MTAKNDGGPAFPVYDDHGQYVNGGGATLRDYFAAKAMHQFLAGAVLPPGFDASELFLMLAARAYEMADAMLKARETA
jgi:hypothetical protein